MKNKLNAFVFQIMNEIALVERLSRSVVFGKTFGHSMAFRDSCVAQYFIPIGLFEVSKGAKEVIIVAKPPWCGAAVSETHYVQTLKL